MLNGKKILSIGIVFMLIASMMIFAVPATAEGENLFAGDGDFESSTTSWSGGTITEDVTAPVGEKVYAGISGTAKRATSAKPESVGIYKLSFYIKYTQASTLVNQNGAYIYWKPAGSFAYPAAAYVPYNKIGEWRLYEAYFQLESTWYDFHLQAQNSAVFSIDDIKLEKVSESNFDANIIKPDFNNTTIVTVNEEQVEVPYYGFSPDSTPAVGVNYKTSNETHNGLNVGKSLQLVGGSTEDDTKLLFYSQAFNKAKPVTYALSFWAKMDSANHAESYAYTSVKLNYFSSSDTLSGLCQQIKMNDGKWHKYVFTGTTNWPQNPFALAIGFKGQGNVIIDDVRLEDANNVDEGINGSFETITNDNKYYGQGTTWLHNGTVTWTDEEAHSGARSLCVADNSSGGNYAILKVAGMKNNAFYRLSWWQKNSADTSSAVQLMLGAPYADFSAWRVKDTWTKQEIYFYYPGSASGSLDVRFRTWSSKYYIDDVEFEEINNEAGFTATEFIAEDGRKLSSIEAGTITVNKPVYGKNKQDNTAYTNFVGVYKVENGIKTLVDIDIVDKKVTYPGITTNGAATDAEKLTRVQIGGSAEVTVPAAVGSETYEIVSFLWNGENIMPLAEADILD